MLMKSRRALVLSALLLSAAPLPAMAQEASSWRTVPAERLLVVETSKGRVLVELFPDVAPAHVERVTTLADQGFYDGHTFHRVIEGFMAQTGDVKFGKSGGASFDPRRAGMGGSDKPNLKAEFSNMNHARGTCSMARAQDPNSANSQFFIMFDQGHFLNGQYTVFGEVVSGMEFVDNIKKSDNPQTGAVVDPDRMVKVRIAADG